MMQVYFNVGLKRKIPARNQIFPELTKSDVSRPQHSVFRTMSTCVRRQDLLISGDRLTFLTIFRWVGSANLFTTAQGSIYEFNDAISSSLSCGTPTFWSLRELAPM